MEHGFHAFEHGHADLVLCCSYNYYGDRFVTGSSDHRMKVWDKKDDNYILCDTWKAHDAEVTDVKFSGPLMGVILGSIGDDCLLKIWAEDPTQTPNGGRRFQCIYKQLSSTRVPYMSLDFKTQATDTFLALTSRDALLTVMEPLSSHDLSEWKVLHTAYLCASPPPSDEAAFALSWHHEALPAWPAVMAGLDRKALSLAVAAMDVVKVFRTDHDRRFYLAATLTGAKALVRDVAWSPGSMRGFDIIAAASKDGYIRFYELRTPEGLQVHPRSEEARRLMERGAARAKSQAVSDAAAAATTSSDAAPSGIGAVLAGGGAGNAPGGSSAAAKMSNGSAEEDGHGGRVKQEVTLKTEVATSHGAVWRIGFHPTTGEVLVSSGDDGVVRLWKRGRDGGWLEHSEVNVARTSGG